MASKKEWRRRAKLAVFAQQQAEARAQQLQETINDLTTPEIKVDEDRVVEGMFEMPTTEDLEKWGRTGESARG